ncbi:uncharacterized protein [Eleutherodactylus coqui]|uniref:uncharacterized protein n=1 Tax=Eleutherodactylus coqui TaxID=57060 RepID=UPI003461988B
MSRHSFCIHGTTVMPHPAVQMGKKKNPIKKVLDKLKNIHMSHPEAGPLLPHKGQPKENPSLKKLKKSLKFEVQITNYVKLKNKVNLCEPQEHCKSKEEQFKSLMGKKEYYNACLFIHDVEQNGKVDVNALYEVVAQEMWVSLTLALDGDHNQAVSLQSISECIQWAKQQKCNKGPDWGPQEWANVLETLFENDIKKYNPQFELKKGLNHYLLGLEKNSSEIITRMQQFPEVLTAAYLKCLHVALLNQLKLFLADKKMKFEDHVLLFKWAHKEHRRLCICRVGSEDFDHMLFGNWFLDSGNKIASTGRDAIYRTLVELLQSEIVWNSYPRGEVRYYFTDVLEEATKMCKAVEDLGDTLVSRLQSLFWEEFLHFVTRYEIFLTEKLGGQISENGVCVGIRIVKNCGILRNAMNNLGAAAQDPAIQEIEKLIGQCEDKGIGLVLNNLKPSLKEAFKNYFNKNSNEYENILRSLKCTLVKEDIQNDQLSDDYLLPSNPFDFISEILTANDYESLRTTTVFFIDKHQDVREEHLNAILNIRGNLSNNEKEDLLYYIRNREMDRDQSKLCFFESVQVDSRKLKFFMCCPC